MKRFYTFAITFLFTLVFLISNAQRLEIPFNNNWKFTGGSVSGETIEALVSIPHTWNATMPRKEWRIIVEKELTKKLLLLKRAGKASVFLYGSTVL